MNAAAASETEAPGTTRRRGDRPPGPERIEEALRAVIDPEIGLDVVSLGLIYELEVDGGEVRVRHTLTTPGCPMEGVLRRWMADAVASVPGVEAVTMELVWEPRWHPGMIREEP